jgi:hypothetical protein
MPDIDVHAPPGDRRSKIQLEGAYDPRVADVEKVWRNTIYPSRFELRPLRLASVAEIVGGILFFVFGLVLIWRLFFVPDEYKTAADTAGFFLFYGVLAAAFIALAALLVARVAKYFRESSIFILPNGLPIPFKSIRDDYRDVNPALLTRPGYFDVEHARATNPIVAPGEVTTTYSPQWTYAPSNMPQQDGFNRDDMTDDDLLSEMLDAPAEESNLPERVDFFDYIESREPGHIMLGINEQGDVMQIPLLRMLNHLVGGAIGSGKSLYLRSLVYQILSEADVSDLPIILGLADIENNTFPEFRNCRHVRWYAANYLEIETMTSSLLKEVERRKTLYESLSSTPKDIERYNILAQRENAEALPVVVVMYDEFSALMHKAQAQQKRILADLLQLALRARKYGIFLVIAGQSFKADIVDSAVLGQFNFSVAFKVRNVATSMSLIGQPGAEKIIQPGEAFVRAKDGQIFRIQAFYLDDDQLLEELETFMDDARKTIPSGVMEIVHFSHDQLRDEVLVKELSEFFAEHGTMTRRELLQHLDWMDEHRFTRRGPNNRRILNWSVINDATSGSS